MTEVHKYNDSNFVLPSVVDFINYESHCVIDIIQLKSEVFKKDHQLSYNGISMSVVKRIKDCPIQTETKIENRLEIRKVRYFCNKL